MKIKSKLKDGVVETKVLASHEMTTYDIAEKKTGNREDANFITHITATINGKVVYEASTSQFLSKNPIFKFSFKGANAGDVLNVSWVDRKGNKEDEKETIK